MLLVIIPCIQGKGQTLIEFRFTGVVNNQHVDMDSIRISNISLGCDTTLYWPDTVLSLVTLGQDDPEHTGNTLEIYRENPVPGMGYTPVLVFLPAMGRLMLKVTDMAGRGLFAESHDLPAGYHRFSFFSSGQNVNILSATWKGTTKSIKLPGIGSGTAGRCLLKYTGQGGVSASAKSAQLFSGFGFSANNVLKYVAFRDTLISVLKDQPAMSTDYTMYFGIYPPCPGLTSFTYGGQEYYTVSIGAQCWMRENLNMGNMIAGSSTQTNNGIIENYCYNDDPANCAVYGGLYQWDEMMQYDTIPGAQGICPPGWHLPTDGEWCTLTTFLDSTVNCTAWGWSGTNAGGKMKETGYTHWSPPNAGATNGSGFTALGAGYCDGGGSFGYLGGDAYFWSSSEHSASGGFARGLYYNSAYVYRCSVNEAGGFSVRCVRTN